MRLRDYAEVSGAERRKVEGAEGEENSAPKTHSKNDVGKKGGRIWGVEGEEEKRETVTLSRTSVYVSSPLSPPVSSSSSSTFHTFPRPTILDHSRRRRTGSQDGRGIGKSASWKEEEKWSHSLSPPRVV